MNHFHEYINEISRIDSVVFTELQKYFQPIEIRKNEYFAKEGKYAKKIGF